MEAADLDADVARERAREGRLMYRLLADRRGAVMVEAALVWPVLFMVLFGSIELAQLLWTRAALSYAAQETARCIVVRPDLCDTDARILTYARARAAPLVLPANALTLTRPACGVQVSIAMPYSPSVGAIVFPSTLTLRGQVCRR